MACSADKLTSHNPNLPAYFDWSGVDVSTGRKPVFELVWKPLNRMSNFFDWTLRFNMNQTSVSLDVLSIELTVVRTLNL